MLLWLYIKLGWSFETGLGDQSLLENLCLVKQIIFRNDFKSKDFDTCFALKQFLLLKGKAFANKLVSPKPF